MTKRAKLLNDNQPGTYRIEMRLQESKTVSMDFNDKFIARTSWDQFNAMGVFAGLVIKDIKFIEVSKLTSANLPLES